jgi:hypothetical protein
MTSAASHHQQLNGNSIIVQIMSWTKMKLSFFCCFITTLSFISTGAQVQLDSAAKRHRIAVFVPLYLDSAFDASGNYRFDKVFPKFLNPGLEFYEGAQLAIDSLQKEKVPIDVQLYDTKALGLTIGQVTASPDFQQTELILGHVDPAELRELAVAAAHLNIPFIDVNFPNDGGISNNPEFVILNSTLRSHCESIYKFIQRNYALSPIYVFRKKGLQEDRLENYFLEIEKNTAAVPLKLKFLTLDEPVDPKQLISHLDSTRKTVCVVGSLDENFGKSVCAQLSAVNKTYVTKIIGMPTWDNIDFSAADYSDQEIYYTTPFYSNPNDSLVISIQQYFRTKFFSRPSDMVFRGYETIYRFAKLLRDFGTNLNSNLGSKKYKLFTDFDIQPVFLNKTNMTLDYFENKKLYFIKKLNGNIVAVY